jgi:hypothetical protein
MILLDSFERHDPNQSSFNTYLTNRLFRKLYKFTRRYAPSKENPDIGVLGTQQANQLKDVEFHQSVENMSKLAQEVVRALFSETITADCRFPLRQKAELKRNLMSRTRGVGTKSQPYRRKLTEKEINSAFKEISNTLSV